MIKLIIIISFAIGNLIGSSLACSCIGKTTVKEEFYRSDVVFTGKILTKEIFTVIDSALPTGLTLKKAVYTILIKKIYKGAIRQDTLKLVTGVGRGDCGYEFAIGKDYIIYSFYAEQYFANGNRVGKFLQTDICTRTKPNEKKELKLIKRYANRQSI